MSESKREGLLDKRITLFGVRMKVKYWIAFWLFLTIGVLGFTMPFIFTQAELDMLGIAVGAIGVMLSALSLISGASREQVDLLTGIAVDLRREMIDFRREVVSELRELRRTIE